ncbi:MAG TPA: 7TM diverse intracellular signaling domain-containing protein, partial [Segetibacter sp.]
MNLPNIIRSRTACLIILILSSQIVESKPIIFSNSSLSVIISKQVEILIAPTSLYTIENIVKEKKFEYANHSAPVFFINKKTLWGRFSVVNHSNNPTLYFCILYPNITEIKFYRTLAGDETKELYSTGVNNRFDTRADDHVDYNFNLYLPPGQTGSYYFKINSVHPIELSMLLMTSEQVVEEHSLRSTIMASYLGVIVSILLYNLFLFFATRDKSYIIYVTYLFALAMAQLTFAGWSFKYFWPNHAWVNSYAVIWTSGFAGIAAIAFAISFLRTAAYAPKIHKFLLGFIAMYVIAVLNSFSRYSYISYMILNLNGMLAGIVLIYISARITARGYRPAWYYLLAWSAFLIGVIIFVFRNMGVLPSNTFTTYVLYGGSAIEAILLSIALADKIAILRKEKEISQADALKISQENEHLVKEQNIVLERKVNERTEELQHANTQVSLAFKNIKDTQIQLVEAEKMASLGQLTAGIAHEINNPINFVKSNIKPLQLDFADLMEVIGEYEKLHDTEPCLLEPQLKEIAALKQTMDLDLVKKEIDSLMKGIENGAERTAEIVRGLRTF